MRTHTHTLGWGAERDRGEGETEEIYTFKYVDQNLHEPLLEKNRNKMYNLTDQRENKAICTIEAKIKPKDGLT